MKKINPAKSKSAASARSTLVAKVEWAVRESIRNGTRYLPGNRLEPLRELADEFGVSHSTVDEALQNLAHRGWLEQRVGGVRVAQELPHRVVAFVSEEEFRSWGSSLAEQLVLQGVNEVLQGAGYRVGIYGLRDPDDPTTQFPKPVLHDALACAQDGMLSGIMVRGCPENVIRFAEQARQIRTMTGLPFVRIQAQPFWNEAHVQIDFRDLVGRQVRYLREAGCRRLAFSSGSTRSNRESVDFQIGVFREELQRAGLDLVPGNVVQVIIEDDAEAKRGYGIYDHAAYELFSHYWAQGKAAGTLPDGLVVTDDTVARSIALALLREGVRVPDDLKVIVATNKGSGVYFPFPFMRCEIDASEIGREASRLILRQLAGDEAAWHQQALVTPKLLPPLAWPSPPPMGGSIGCQHEFNNR